MTPPYSVEAGTESILEEHLVPGVMIKGTLTEAGTGLPVEGLTYPPYSVPSICALEAQTEARIKCTFVGHEGHYALPGLPPGKPFGVVFAKDGVEEGLDLWNDGYVRQYWDHVPTWQEAAIVSATGGATFSGVDAALTRGAEVFPHCEVSSACPPPPDGPGTLGVPFQEGVPRVRTPLPVHCKKGFRKVTRAGHARCVKLRKKRHKRRHHTAPGGHS